jgi:tetratricopeptide (TPR) repeat protein
MKKAFVVRPFGEREGIDFEKVERELIRPVFEALEVDGGTTGLIVEAGNIREDMFEQLLVSDLVIADISIHNANVFYELGIRHALQARHTFLIRARRVIPAAERKSTDEVPFDLRTDRYLEYDPARPADSVSDLKAGIAASLISDRQDSPVFRLLPGLEEQDRSRFLNVHTGFREEVELAAKAQLAGRLSLLALEAQNFGWASEGLRLIGRAQFKLKDLDNAKSTWEALQQWYPDDCDANQMLGTVYQRLGDLDASDQALERVMTNPRAEPRDRAEALSLLGRNIKERWRASWAGLEGESRQKQALRSTFLLQSFEKYKAGFEENLNSFYPGLNALSLQTVMVELGRRMPALWKARPKAPPLDEFERDRSLLAGAVWTALSAAKEVLARSGKEDRWVNISEADYQFLTGAEPESVGYLYEAATAGASVFEIDAVRRQLEIFEQLDLLPEHVAAALSVVPKVDIPPSLPAPRRIVLFTGHMIDAPDRAIPRFPASAEAKARSAIMGALRDEVARTKGDVVGIAFAACGGDLLFHECCAEAGLKSLVLLPVPPDRFRTDSVAPAGPAWTHRFDALINALPGPPQYLATTDQLPTWLSTRPNYTTWQRANLWLLQEALARRPEKFTLLALWDGTKGDGPGGTEHMIRIVRDRRDAATIILDTKSLFGLDQPAATAAAGPTG